MSTTTKKEGAFTFVIIRGERPKKERGQKEEGPKRWRGVVAGMKKLRVTDYLIAANEVPGDKVKRKLAYVKYCVTQELGKSLPRRQFYFASIPEDEGKEGFKIIIKRLV